MWPRIVLTVWAALHLLVLPGEVGAKKAQKKAGKGRTKEKTKEERVEEALKMAEDLMKEADTNGDGSLDMSEFTASSGSSSLEAFKKVDQDSDGILSQREVAGYFGVVSQIIDEEEASGIFVDHEAAADAGIPPDEAVDAAKAKAEDAELEEELASHEEL
jgi:Ca2+-binding EF-hand superfamily protein